MAYTCAAVYTCDKCGKKAKSFTAPKYWSKINISIWPHGTISQDESQQYDLCPDCFSTPQKALVFFSKRFGNKPKNNK